MLLDRKTSRIALLARAGRPGGDAQDEDAPDEGGSARERRLEKLREVQRATILEAAEEIFAAHGYYVAKMSDIAKQAGFSTGSLYNYFSGKEEIFATLVASHLEGLWDLLDAELKAPGEFMQTLQRLIAIYATYMDEHRRLFQIIHHTIPATIWGPASSEATDAYELMGTKNDLYARFIELIQRILQRGIDQGVLRDLDPKTLAVMLVGTMDSFNQLWLQEESARPFAEQIPFVLDVFLNGVRT